MKEAVLEEMRQHFRPEFLNRVDEIIVFHALSEEHLKQIVEIQLERLRARLADRHITLELTDAARAAPGAHRLRSALRRAAAEAGDPEEDRNAAGPAAAGGDDPRRPDRGRRTTTAGPANSPSSPSSELVAAAEAVSRYAADVSDTRYHSAQSLPIATWTIIRSMSWFSFLSCPCPRICCERLFYLFGVVPARFTHPEWARLVGLPIDTYWPFLTSMFLHGGWLHIFGTCGPCGSLATTWKSAWGRCASSSFYLLCGLLAGVGAFLHERRFDCADGGRFRRHRRRDGRLLLCFIPYARIIVMIPISSFPSSSRCRPCFILASGRSPRSSAGTLSLATPGEVGGVAWWAHVGGFTGGNRVALLLCKAAKIHTGGLSRRVRNGRRLDAGRLLEGHAMTPGDLIWMFFVFSALQPVAEATLPGGLPATAHRAGLSSERKSRVILLVHRQETMSILGFPVSLYRCERLRRSPASHSSHRPRRTARSGVAHAGWTGAGRAQIARAILKHQGKVTAFVPHYAMSGGTLIALAAGDRDERVRGAWAR